MDVTLPDGSVIQGVPEGTTKAQLAEKLKANGRDVPAEWMQSQESQPRSFLQETGRQLGLTARAGIEGAAALPLAITDSLVTIKRALGFQSGKKASEVLSEGLTGLGVPQPETGTERVVQDITGSMGGTYGMARGLSKGAVRLSEILGGGASGGLAGGVREAGGPEWAQTLAGLAPGVRGPRQMLGLKPPAESITAPGNEVKLRTWQDANALGYKFPPSAIERGFGRERLESIGGKTALNQEASLHNAQITDEIGRKDAGLQPKQEITERSLEAARNGPMSDPYREVARLSPTAASAWEEVRSLRARAKLYYNEHKRQGTVESWDKAEQLSREAEIYEGMIEAEAKRVAPNSSLVEDLRTARRDLARNYDVESALNLGNGHLDPAIIGKMVDRRGTRAITGGLGLIGKTQQAFPQYMVEPSKVPTPGVNKLEALASLGMGGYGYHAGGLKGAIAAGIALPAASYTARKIALSGLQGPQQGIPLSAVTNFLARQTQENNQ